MNIIRSTIDFVKLNHEKGMTIKAYFYSAYYRIIIKFVPMNRIEKIMGVRGEESSVEETDENIPFVGWRTCAYGDCDLVCNSQIAPYAVLYFGRDRGGA